MNFKQVFCGFLTASMIMSYSVPAYSQENITSTNSSDLKIVDSINVGEMELSNDNVIFDDVIIISSDELNIVSDKSIFIETNSDFIKIERATGEVEIYSFNDPFDEVIIVSSDELNIISDKSNLIVNDFNSIKTNENTYELDSEMRQTWNINWNIPAYNLGYGTAILNLFPGDVISYRITPQRSGGFATGVVSNRTNEFHLASQYSGIALHPITGSFTITSMDSYSFGIYNTNPLSNTFNGNFTSSR